MKNQQKSFLRLVEDLPETTARALLYAQLERLTLYNWQELRRFLESMRGVSEAEIVGLRLELLKAVAHYFKVPAKCRVIRATRRSLLDFLWDFETEMHSALRKRGAGPLVDRILGGINSGTIALPA